MLRTPAAASPCQHCRRPLRAVHLRGWHNEPCPQLNLPLPLPAASELPAGLFLFPFCLYSQVVHSQLASSLCLRPPPRLIMVSSHDESLGLSCVCQMGMALLGRTWSSPAPIPVPGGDIPEEWPKPECGNGMGGQQGEFCHVWWGQEAMGIWLQTWNLSPERMNPAFG